MATTTARSVLTLKMAVAFGVITPVVLTAAYYVLDRALRLGRPTTGMIIFGTAGTVSSIVMNLMRVTWVLSPSIDAPGVLDVLVTHFMGYPSAWGMCWLVFSLTAFVGSATSAVSWIIAIASLSSLIAVHWHAEVKLKRLSRRGASGS